MLFVFVQDMEDELIRLGSGRSRGLGKVKGNISDKEEGVNKGGVLLSSARVAMQHEEPDSELWGLGHWLDKEATTYGTRTDDILTLSSPIAHTTSGVRRTRVVKGNDLENLKERSIEAFVTRMQTWKSPA